MLGRGDALLELAHVGAECWLIADGAGHAAEQRGNFGVGLHEAENIVDEKDDVLAFVVAEIFGDGDAGQRDAGARAGRLVHLAVHQRGFRDDARLAQLAIEVVALARALADAGEHRHAAVLFRDVVDQLENRDGLADAGAAEQADFSAASERANQVEDLDAGLEDFRLGRLVGKRRRVAMYRHQRSAGDRPALVDRGAGHVHDAAERAWADRHRDWRAGVVGFHPAHEPVGRVHRDAAHGVLAHVLLHFEHEITGLVADGGVGDEQSREDRRQRAGAELDVNHVAEDLVYFSGSDLRLIVGDFLLVF